MEVAGIREEFFAVADLDTVFASLHYSSTPCFYPVAAPAGNGRGTPLTVFMIH